jgi:tetratricopeptide (TPR) repeat protein
VKPTRDANDLSLAELFRNYLQRQVMAQEENLGNPEPGDAVPHHYSPVDPRLAWESAVAVLPHLVAGPAPSLKVPPDWPTFVTNLTPAVAVAFSLGNFPQLVRDKSPLLGGDLAVLRVPPLPSAPPPDLVAWAKQTHSGAQALLAAGLLRLAGQFDDAEAVLRSADMPVPLQALRANEAAALVWHRGRAEEARVAWGEQQATVPVLFNLGMASLFLGRLQDAQFCLTEAVDQLPETSAWHHLGQLYLALVASRR